MLWSKISECMCAQQIIVILKNIKQRFFDDFCQVDILRKHSKVSFFSFQNDWEFLTMYEVKSLEKISYTDFNSLYLGINELYFSQM